MLLLSRSFVDAHVLLVQRGASGTWTSSLRRRRKGGEMSISGCSERDATHSLYLVSLVQSSLVLKFHL